MHQAIRLWSVALALLCAVVGASAKYSGEYYWNHDPGIGSATRIAAYDIGADGTVDLEFDTSDIKPGLNLLGVRVYNGRWSPTVTSFVYVADQAKVSDGVCEYWWDADPGYGAANRLTFDTDGNSVVDLEMDIDGLTHGLHTLGMRTIVNGRWSPTTTTLVYIQAPDVKVDYIEYFWGIDPGCGNGTRIDVNSPDEILVLDEVDMDLPTGPVNDYTIGVRAHTTTGQWGTCYYETYSLGASVTVCLDMASLTIDGIDDIQQLTASVDSDDPAWPRPVTWTSSDESVAKVDSTGLVRAVGKGECVIRAECVGCGAYDECTVRVTASRVLLNDGITYDSTEDQEEMNITYRRTFDHDMWQPLYLPYSISHDEWAEYADVAEVACVHMYDDGRTVIEFLTVHSGDLQPHMPYVIKPRGTGTVEFESRNRTLYGVPQTDNPIMCCTPRWAYTFHGVYDTKDNLEDTGAYVLNEDCKFVHTTEPLAPNRFYMLRSRTNQGYWPRTLSDDDADEIYIMVDGELIDPSRVIIGDVNTDGKITVSDIVSLVSHLLGSTPEVFDMKAADVNGDAKLTVTDVVGIVDIILKGSS